MANDELYLKIPHSLGATEARKRIAGGIDAAKTQYGQYLGGLDTEWEGNRLDFRVSALAQTVRGSVEVGDQFVELRAKLPVVLRLLARRFAPVVETNGKRLLT